ncbi:MAG: hypothetical protein ACFFBE_17925 [Promethearchaeota archaeon]
MITVPAFFGFYNSVCVVPLPTSITSIKKVFLFTVHTKTIK